MELKCIEGRAELRPDAVVLTFDSSVAMPVKKEVGQRVIPLNHVREVDFVAPSMLKPGHLRIVMRTDQERGDLNYDTYAVRLGGGRRLKEAKDFAEQLQTAVNAVDYEEPAAPTDAIKIATPFKDLMKGLQEAGDAYTEARKSVATFRTFALSGDTVSYGRKKWPASDCEIVIDTGANVSARVTATRVAAGALLAGTAGALIGSIAKKDRSTIYMTLITPDDMFLEKVSGLDEAKAREFAMKVKRAGMKQTRAAAEAQAAVVSAEDTVAAAITPPAPPPPGVPAGWYPHGGVQEYWDGSVWTGHTAPLAPQGSAPVID